MSDRVLMVDANVCSLVFGDDPEFEPVRAALFLGRPKPWSIAHGGRVTDELRLIAAASRALVQLERAGRTKEVTRKDVEAETERLTHQGTCVSNDHHVIAVARLSRAKLLCSHDEKLAKDFKNKDLLSDPRGRVYRDRRQAHLLRGSW